MQFLFVNYTLLKLENKYFFKKKKLENKYFFKKKKSALITDSKTIQKGHVVHPSASKQGCTSPDAEAS
jgi:hypothetical protein